MRLWLLGLLLTGAVGAEPDREAVWQAVEAAGLPRSLVVLREAAHFPEVTVVGRNEANGPRLNAVFLEGRYLSPNQATAAVLRKLDAGAATAWTCEVLLAFQGVCVTEPAEFRGHTDFFAPEATAEGGGFRVRLWLREQREFLLCTYQLNERGVSRTVQQRRRF